MPSRTAKSIAAAMATTDAAINGHSYRATRMAMV